MLFPSSGTDLSAQLARATFARENPLTPLDLSWYAGFHPYSYSLLAPWLMALLGVAVCGVVAAVGASVLFARLLRDSDRPMLAAVFGALFWSANIASGRVTFGLGALAALGALVALPRRPTAGSLALLTGLLSPVAAAFLGFVAAVLVLHRRAGGWTLGICTTIPVVCLAVLFPGGGVQPLSPGAALPGVLAGLAVGLLTSNPLLRTGGLLYAAAVVFFLLHRDPFGSNVLRLGLLVGISLLLAATAHRSARVLTAVSLGMLGWQLDPLVTDLLADAPPSMTAMVAELERAGARRVEVLAGRDHREAYTVARVVPLARGWARQIDVRDNGLFYRGDPLSPQEYRAWLDRNAVDHVAMPKEGSLDFGSVRAGEVLQRGVPGLERSWEDAGWVVFRVRDARPVAAPPAEVVAYDRASLTMRSAVATAVPVDIRWSRWLSVTGPGCLERAGQRVTVRFSAAGTVRLSSSLRPEGRC